MSDTKAIDDNRADRMIHVSVITEYLSSQSQPDKNRFVFAYHITITNQEPVDVKLLSRHWIIIDADQKRQEVNGIGVIGEQPLIASGDSFKYSSGVVLSTPVGTMHGSYEFVDLSGGHFEAPIQPFLLAMPNKVN
jgi:ApaG protein